ncbi:MAG: BamA/TamA family outer membrane protein [Fidelibacterota bacterium]|nr:MAG: BamA/TamA family outer membrane protein [Candidatus Neomarinimicrobiota bacterium]
MPRLSWFALLPLGLFIQVIPLQGQPPDLSIERIVIEATDTLSFKPRTISGLMKLKAAQFVARGTPFSRRTLRVDAITIENFYISRGYLEAQVVDSFAVTSGNQVEIYIKITQGQQFRLHDVVVVGNRLLSKEEIVQYLGLTVGEPYNPVQVRTRLEALRHYYQDQGKLTIDILEEIEVNGGVQLRLSISEGLTYKIGDITVVGLEKTPEWYVLRELLFKSGDTFDRGELLLSQQRVFESGMFGAVEMIPTLQAAEPGIADIEVRVRELERRSIDLSLGFSQEEDPGGGDPNTALSATSQWWHARILDTSLRTGITLEGGLILQDLTSPTYLVAVDIITPWTFGLRLPASLRVYEDHTPYPSEIRRRGVALSLLSRRTKRHQFRGSLGWDTIDAEVSDNTATREAQRSIKFEYQYQGVDNLLAPTKGTIFQFKPSLNGTFGDTVHFYYRIEADVRRYHSIVSKMVLAYRLKLSYLETIPFGGARVLEPHHLYDLGGSTSLRGWAAPDSFLVASGVSEAKGGLIKGLMNLELRTPLFWIIGGEIFIDAGALRVFLEPDDLEDTSEQGKLKWIAGWDAGIGITLTTPLGPIRIDTAYPLGEYWTGKPTYQVAFLHTF